MPINRQDLILTPLRIPVPFWEQTTPIIRSVSPKRDCGPKRLNRLGLQRGRSDVKRGDCSNYGKLQGWGEIQIVVRVLPCKARRRAA